MGQDVKVTFEYNHASFSVFTYHNSAFTVIHSSIIYVLSTDRNIHTNDTFYHNLHKIKYCPADNVREGARQYIQS